MVVDQIHGVAAVAAAARAVAILYSTSAGPSTGRFSVTRK